MSNQIQITNSQLVSKNQTTTSKIMASVFNKRHNDLLSTIRKLDTDIQEIGIRSFTHTPFTPIEYINPQNKQKYTEYEITKDGFILLAMGFNGKEALKFKIDYINAFNEMAKQLELQNQPKLQTLEKNIKTLEHNNKSLCEVISRYESGLTHAMARELQKHIAGTVRLKINDKSRQSKAYSFIYSKLKDYFSVSKYSEILKTSFGEAKQFVTSLKIPEYVYVEQMDILDAKPKKSSCIENLSDDTKTTIYIQKVAPQLLQIMHSVIDKTETLLIKGSVGRTNFLDSTLQEIKAKSQIVEALLKSA